ncbi:hypothetical protein HPB51_002333 [Rhipicephalus microplus]|uniref:Uncharacterized protein n=1 Tax=Rhipicephalus microplus TaxID=6941 RepID=A0A9J6DRV8_RHIMP|nr:hypothetical protein HPB51_002333 [Rhipicephalus microplus]
MTTSKAMSSGTSPFLTPPTPGVFSPTTNDAAPLATAPTLLTPPTGTLGTAVTLNIIELSATSRLLADRSQSSGVVKVVHENYNDDDLLANSSPEVGVVAAKKRGMTLVHRFAAPTHPAIIYLFNIPSEEQPCRPQPQQCLCCGCYGQATATFERPGAGPVVWWPTPGELQMF